MATYRDKLLELDEDIRIEIVKAVIISEDLLWQINNVLDIEFDSWATFISSIFLWSGTPQGHDYWAKKTYSLK